MTSLISKITLGASLLALSACAGFGTITRTDTTTFYSALGVSAASVGGLPTEIYGPAAITSDQAALLGGVKTPSWAGNAGLVPRTAGYSRSSGNRLVLSVSNDVAIGNTLCRNPAAGGGASSTPLKINAALCIGDEYYSRGTLKLPAGATPGTAAYQTAMNQLMNAMMPRINPETDLRNEAEWPF